MSIHKAEVKKKKGWFNDCWKIIKEALEESPEKRKEILKLIKELKAFSKKNK